MSFSNQKLFQLIDSFTKDELDQFRIFISSPIFTKGRNYTIYLDHILELKHKKELTAKPKRSKSGIAGIEISDQTFRNRCSELYKLGEEFLIYLGLNENSSEKRRILLRKLYEKKLQKSFISNYKKSADLISNEKFDIAKLKKLMSLSEILSEFYVSTNKIEILYDEFFEFSKLVLCLNLLELFQLGFEFHQLELNDRKFANNYVMDYLNSLNIEKTIREFESSDKLVFRIIAMNYYLFKAFGKDTDGKLYSESYRLFTGLSADLKENYRINLFKCMTNLCISKLNKGENDYRFKLFELYNKKLDQNLTADLKVNSYDFNHFRDYIYIGISIKKYRWVMEFIKKYSIFLPLEMRGSETRLSYAKLDFEKKKYQRSLENLIDIKATHYLQYIDISLLKLCIYYELKKFEEALLEIDKQNHYLKNHKEIPRVQYLYAANYSKLYKLMIKYKIDPNIKDKGIIETEYKKFKQIAKRKWLEEKISEISM